MIRGTTHILNISLSDSSNGSYVLPAREVLRFGVKKRPSDRAYLIKKELTSANYENGVYVLILSPSDTEELPFGRYYYDVGLQNGDSYFNVIECSEFDVLYNITEREDAE
jgi:hypothetical protein